jgi:hypothetical protein
MGQAWTRGMHCLMPVAPGAEVVPKGQGLQSSMVPPSEKVPLGHRLQMPLPVGEPNPAVARATAGIRCQLLY